MAVLDDLKILLPSSADAILNLYIREATTLITNYLNSSTVVDVATVYPDAIIKHVVLNCNKKGNEGQTSFVQGARQGAYEKGGLSQSVKDLLPLPCVKMRGVYVSEL